MATAGNQYNPGVHREAHDPVNSTGFHMALTIAIGKEKLCFPLRQPILGEAMWKH